MKLWAEDDNGTMLEIQEIDCLGDGNCLILQLKDSPKPLKQSEISKLGDFLNIRTGKDVIFLPSEVNIIGTI